MYSINQEVLKFTIVFFIIVFPCTINLIKASPVLSSRAYYVNISGNDENTGDKNHPYKTIAKINSVELKAGDSVLFEGGQTFKGTLKINSNESGLANRHIYIFSSGAGFAIIESGHDRGLSIDSAKYIQVHNLHIKGSGRKQGNTSNGVILNNCNNVLIDNLTITGFQKAGLLIYSSSQITITHVHAYENGFAGISVESKYDKKDSRQIYIADCLAENNPGDPSNINNHSGNGIVAGNCRNVTIEYCRATNNGWDMPRVGNGPVGIWCYEADSITIQYCISYRNKTAKGADDGGGFDLDGGVTNSIIQYCLSYENQGSGFGIFQYAGASAWHDNIIRYNISSNDGSVSAAHASVYVWNSTGDEEQFSNLVFYNNIVYNTQGASIHYAKGQDKRTSFNFYNNIFVAKDEIIKGNVSADIFSGNTWWSLAGGFHIDSLKNFKAWRIKTGKEQMKGKLIGLNINPLKNVNYTILNDPHKLKSVIRNELVKRKMYKQKIR